MSTVRQPAIVTAYLLRCWMEGSVWRYSLEEVGTEKRHGFATLDEFVSFMLVRSMQPDDREYPGDEVGLAEREPNSGAVANSSSCDER
jgi:hypothetical protein